MMVLLGWDGQGAGCLWGGLGYHPAMQDNADATGPGGGQAVVPPEADGWRLDRAVGLVVAGAGLRGRRRLIEAGRVLVDGVVCRAACRVRAGQMVAVAGEAAPAAAFSPADVQILFAGETYAAVAKPAGLHSAALAQGGGQALEGLLPQVFPGRDAVLLSRLDRLTTGIVPVAFGEGPAGAYRRLEAAGQVEKPYLIVAHGVMEGPFVVDRELDVANRARTRVLDRPAADPLRRTRVEPVAASHGLTLARCRIAKGARHQIRAHLAASGHPLVGDPVYGRGEGARLFLHCAALASPVLSVACDPPWSIETATAVTGQGGEGARQSRQSSGPSGTLGAR